MFFGPQSLPAATVNPASSSRFSGIRSFHTCAPTRFSNKSPFAHENDMLVVTTNPSSA